jgi:hypothetical protein
MTANILVIDVEASPDREWVAEVAWLLFSQSAKPIAAYVALVVADEQQPEERVVAHELSKFGHVLVTRKRVPLAFVLHDLKAVISEYPSMTLVGHNVEWDVSVLRKAERDCGINSGAVELPRVCTMLAACEHGPGSVQGSHLSLPNLVKALLHEGHANWHNAFADARACAECFWQLHTAGATHNYCHERAVSYAGRNGGLPRAQDAERSIRKAIRSGIAIGAVRERARQASVWHGQVDATVLERILKLSPAELDVFTKKFGALFTTTAARRVRKKIDARPSELVLEPDTVWRCVIAYCLIVDRCERESLGTQLLNQHPKPVGHLELHLTSPAVHARAIIAENSCPSDHLITELRGIAGGDADLVAHVVREHQAKFENQKRALEGLVTKVEAGDQTSLGEHHFALAHGTIEVSVRRRSAVASLVRKFFG